MIIDFEQIDTRDLQADVCVVGAGATGLALAHDLADSGRRVAVVESGSRAEHLNSGESVGTHALELEASRARGFGGTTQLWAGQCVPFEREDFGGRDWVPHADWPFPRSELDPHYRRAEALLGVPATDYGESAWQPFGLRPAPVDPEVLQHRCTAMPREVHMGRLTSDRLEDSATVTVLLGATVSEVVLDDSGERVGGVELRSLAGRSARLRAPVVVLCAGALENARLLLLSGLGNEHDQVGRWLQDHPNAYAATVRTRNPRFLQDRYGLLYSRRARWFPRLALSPSATRRERTLQAAAVVSFEYPADSAVTALRAAARTGSWRGAVRLLSRPREIAHVGWRRFVRGRSPALRPSRIALQVFTEQEPDPGRRVTLGERRDALGLPVTKVEWGVGSRELDATRTLVGAIGKEFERLGIGEVEPEPWLTDGDTSHFRDAFHHIGTTRMSTDPREGVVDPNLEVHGVRGLYCAGASSFPSSSWANPVLTAVALTLRLGEHLRRNGSAPA